MITGILPGARSWAASPRLRSILSYLEQTLTSPPADGRYELDDGAYAGVSSYVTKDAGASRFEAHRKFIDVQFMLAGEESIWVAEAQALRLTEAYSDERDVAFFAPPARSHKLEMTTGSFAVFFPENAHMPGVQLDAPASVRKIVVKVPVRMLQNL